MVLYPSYFFPRIEKSIEGRGRQSNQRGFSRTEFLSLSLRLKRRTTLARSSREWRRFVCLVRTEFSQTEFSAANFRSLVIVAQNSRGISLSGEWSIKFQNSSWTSVMKEENATIEWICCGCRRNLRMDEFLLNMYYILLLGGRELFMRKILFNLTLLRWKIEMVAKIINIWILLNPS